MATKKSTSSYYKAKDGQVYTSKEVARQYGVNTDTGSGGPSGKMFADGSSIDSSNNVTRNGSTYKSSLGTPTQDAWTAIGGTGGSEGYLAATGGVPSTPNIPVSEIAPTQALKLPEMSTDTAIADGMAGMAQTATTGIESYMKQLTAPETEASKKESALQKSLDKLLEASQGQTETLIKEENRLGLPQLQASLADINSQILTKSAAYDQQYNKQENELAPMSSIIGKQAAVRKTEAAEIGFLTARALGMQGQIEAARETAERAVKLKFGPILEAIDVKMKQLQILQPILDKEEKKFAAALNMKLADDKERAQKEEKKFLNNLNLAIEQGVSTKWANNGGEVYNVSTGEGFENEAEFQKATGISVAEAYSRGMITDISYNRIAERGSVQNLINSFPDAGITFSDTLADAQAKLSRSRIYQDAVRGPVGSGGGSTGALGLTNQQIDNISPLVTQFQNSPIVQNYNTIGEGYQFANSLANDTTNPADDQALIYALAKALDPGSVVREGEYATAQKYAQSMTQSYGKSVTQAISGTGFLSQDARRNIKATIESRFKAAESSYKNLYSETERRVNLVGNTDKGSQLLNNYGGAFAQPSQSNNLIGPVQPAQNQTAEQEPQRNFMQKVGNWLWGND